MDRVTRWFWTALNESVKASIHALKLHHNGLESHTTRRRRSRGGRNGGGWRIRPLGPWPFRSKLGLALPSKSYTDGTHDSIERRIRSKDRKMVKDPHDSRRKNELITGRHIPIDIYDRDNEMSGEVNREVL